MQMLCPLIAACEEKRIAGKICPPVPPVVMIEKKLIPFIRYFPLNGFNIARCMNDMAINGKHIKRTHSINV